MRLPAVARETLLGYVATYAAFMLALIPLGFWAVLGHDRVAFFATLAFAVLAFIVVSLVEGASKRLLSDDAIVSARGTEVAAAGKTARTMLIVSTAAPLAGYALYQFAGRSLALLAILGMCVIVWAVLSIAAPASIVRRFG